LVDNTGPAIGPAVPLHGSAEAVRGASVQAILSRPLADAYRNDSRLDQLSEAFVSDGYVKLPHLLRGEAIELLREEVAALEPRAQARDFMMPGPGTPRVMSVLGASQLLARSTVLPMLYAHFELVRLISRLARALVYACPHPEELMVCNFLLTDLATHGWHLDDPAYALIFVVDAPALGTGGELEYIADWEAVCAELGADPGADVEPVVTRARAAGLVTTMPHRAGDAYLLRADQCLHRVAPLSAPGRRRVALNFAYEATPTATYGDSATLLYGPASTVASDTARPADKAR
jgi:hypothetical protein